MRVTSTRPNVQRLGIVVVRDGGLAIRCVAGIAESGPGATPFINTGWPSTEQTGGMEGDCIFCRIIEGSAPSFLVAEDDRTLAFLDRSQATQGHTLVVPRSHAADIWAIAESDACAVMAMAKRVAHLLEDRLSPDGLNLTQSNRPAGWQDVFHFHLHVIPRWEGDGLVPPWRSTRPSDEDLAATLARLR